VVSISNALTVENAGAYYRAHYSTVGEYYAPTEAPTIGQIVGKGSEALGLEGDITAEQFESLLKGIDPNSGAVLRTHATRAEATERAGFDMTFSPPKSVSIQALVAGDTRLIQAARDAALRAIQEAERCALAVNTPIVTRCRPLTCARLSSSIMMPANQYTANMGRCRSSTITLS
jgi:conjugative relaxase-like TrwC/TraI family protein